VDERILIPLDGSDLAETISSFAERIAGPGILTAAVAAAGAGRP
jgi:hypothetical protein